MKMTKKNNKYPYFPNRKPGWAMKDAEDGVVTDDEGDVASSLGVVEGRDD